ncbi:MAG: chemotaxis protein CheW [Alcaligenaceae bacterium]
MNRSSPAHIDPSTSYPAPQSIELLTFWFNEVIFALDILKVEEIHGYEIIYPQIGASKSIHQVMTVRGNKIQMIDLAIKFGLVKNNDHCPKNIIILNAHERQFGIAIDGVTEVITTDKSMINMPMQRESEMSYLHYSSGLIKVDENLLVVLDLDKLITHDDLASVDGLYDE